MIVIINYGTGNLTSVQNMLRKVGVADVKISSDAEDIQKATKLILPGVGRFDYGMQKLKESGLVDTISSRVLNDKIPILGICLGAQLMTKKSDEGIENGLGWIDAETVLFDKTKLASDQKIPHMGWNYTTSKKDTALFDAMREDPRFYFVHSYHLVMNDPTDVWLTTNYGYEFCSAFQRDNIYACQFHPEKSHKFGMKVMENFANL